MRNLSAILLLFVLFSIHAKSEEITFTVEREDGHYVDHFFYKYIGYDKFDYNWETKKLVLKGKGVIKSDISEIWPNDTGGHINDLILLVDENIMQGTILGTHLSDFYSTKDKSIMYSKTSWKTDKEGKSIMKIQTSKKPFNDFYIRI